MKKLLSIAIAAVVAAPMAVMADTTVYGIVDLGLVNTDPDVGNDSWDIGDQNGSSRFGVKGSEDLGNGMKAVFQYEWSTNDDFGNGINTTAGAGLNARLAFVGLSSSWGTVAIGRQWNPYYFAVGKTNIFDMGGTHSTYLAHFGAALGGYRVGDAITYNSPNMNGFTVGGMVQFSDDLGDDANDNFALAGQYNNGPLSLGLGYINPADDAINDSDVWGASGKYNFGNFMIGAAYEDGETNGTDMDSWDLVAQAYFGNNTVSIGYGEMEVGATETEEFNIGLRHSFSKRTRAWVEYEAQEVGGADTDRFGFGLRHDF
ncbi:MAG: porin [Sedimenticola sp.]|nr:porin [Sedimenticola sp.]